MCFFLLYFVLKLSFLAFPTSKCLPTRRLLFSRPFAPSSSDFNCPTCSAVSSFCKGDVFISPQLPQLPAAKQDGAWSVGACARHKLALAAFCYSKPSEE